MIKFAGILILYGFLALFYVKLALSDTGLD